MAVKFGDMLKPRVAQGEVSVSAPDSNGIVVWKFKNTGNTTGSWLLQRGASMGGTQFEDYLFCGAFSPLYLYNGSLFGTELLAAPPTPLVDKGTANNSMPMAVINTPSGRTIAFIFTLSPGQVWSCEEGGFSGGVTPSNPKLIPVTVENGTPQTFCWHYNSEQCQGYNQQTGSNLPCPPNPYQISSILMQVTESVPILFNDPITDGACSGSGTPPSCLQMIQQGIADNDMQEVLAGLQCLMEQEFLSVFDVIETALKAVRSKM